MCALVDRTDDEGGALALDVAEHVELLLEALDGLLVAHNVLLVLRVALGDELAILAELGLHHLDVVGDAVHVHHQGRGNSLVAELVESFDEVGPVLELLSERQDGIDLGVMPGGLAEPVDGLVDHAQEVARHHAAHQHQHGDQHHDQRGSDDGQKHFRGFHGWNPSCSGALDDFRDRYNFSISSSNCQ